MQKISMKHEQHGLKTTKKNKPKRMCLQKVHYSMC